MVWQLAWRYMRGKGSANVVPILSRISMLAIAVGSGALIVLFSVFNGFENLIKDLYKAFYPELRITPAKGKFFALEPAKLQAIQKIDGITAISRVIEDKVLVNSQDEQMVAVLKGVDRQYFRVNNIKPYIYAGRDSVTEGAMPTAILGLFIANQMAVDVDNVFSRLSIHYPNAITPASSLNPTDAIQSLQLKPDGVFRVQDEFDRQYILAPLFDVQGLFGQPDRFSSLELSVRPGSDPANLKRQLQQALGNAFHVDTRYEQNKTMYLVMQTEKWAVYAILLLVLLIASFNMVGALTLLVMEKRKDVAMLKAMGARSSTIHKIFLMEGILWAFTGGTIGLVVGGLLCLGQQKFHWIRLQGMFIIDSYPVSMLWSDFLVVILTVMVIGFLAALYPALRATRVEDPSLKAS